MNDNLMLFTQDFVYPDNIAYPFGGEEYIMIELHYDNPQEIEGNV